MRNRQFAKWFQKKNKSITEPVWQDDITYKSPSQTLKNEIVCNKLDILKQYRRWTARCFHYRSNGSTSSVYKNKFPSLVKFEFWLWKMKECLYDCLPTCFCTNQWKMFNHGKHTKTQEFHSHAQSKRYYSKKLSRWNPAFLSSWPKITYA